MTNPTQTPSRVLAFEGTAARDLSTLDGRPIFAGQRVRVFETRAGYQIVAAGGRKTWTGMQIAAVMDRVELTEEV